MVEINLSDKLIIGRQTQFLNEMFRDLDCFIRWMLVDSTRPIIRYENMLDSLNDDELNEKNEDGYNVFFSVCGRNRKSGTKESVSVVPTLWADIDKEDAIEVACYNPSFAVYSGHGWHLYWLLDKPFYVTSDIDRIKVEAILRGLAQSVGGDTVFDVTRMLRLPETINWKEKSKPVLCYVHTVNRVEGKVKRYSLNTFEEYAVESPIANIEPVTFSDKPVEVDIDQY